MIAIARIIAPERFFFFEPKHKKARETKVWRVDWEKRESESKEKLQLHREIHDESLFVHVLHNPPADSVRLSSQMTKANKSLVLVNRSLS